MTILKITSLKLQLQQKIVFQNYALCTKVLAQAQIIFKSLDVHSCIFISPCLSLPCVHPYFIFFRHLIFSEWILIKNLTSLNRFLESSKKCDSKNIISWSVINGELMSAKLFFIDRKVLGSVQRACLHSVFVCVYSCLFANFSSQNNHC